MRVLNWSEKSWAIQFHDNAIRKNNTEAKQRLATLARKWNQYTAKYWENRLSGPPLTSTRRVTVELLKFTRGKSIAVCHLKICFITDGRRHWTHVWIFNFNLRLVWKKPYSTSLAFDRNFRQWADDTTLHRGDPTSSRREGSFNLRQSETYRIFQLRSKKNYGAHHSRTSEKHLGRFYSTWRKGITLQPAV